MSERTYNVLILCTGNSARSIMAEALINTMGQGRFRAYSAGSHPTGKVNPFAIEKAQSVKYPTDNLRSKSWDEFAAPDAPSIDFVITVCDNAAAETCPIWPGHPAHAHWGVPDPAAVDGDDETKRRAYGSVMATLRRRVELLLSLPLDKLDRVSAQAHLREIGRAT